MEMRIRLENEYNKSMLALNQKAMICCMKTWGRGPSPTTHHPPTHTPQSLSQT